MGKHGAVAGSDAANRSPAEIVPPLVILPKPPPWLNQAAKKRWRDLGALLVEEGRITALDGDLFATLCVALADIPRLRAKIYGTAKTKGTGEVVITPNGALQRHPNTIFLREAQDRAMRLSQRFGLSPADRARVPSKGKAKAPDPTGKFFE